MTGGRRTAAASPLGGSVVRYVHGPPSLRYAASLLGLLGAEVQTMDVGAEEGSGSSGDPVLALDGVEVSGASAGADAASDWAGSGAMALTGRREGPPLVAPGAPATAARAAGLAIEALTTADDATQPVAVDGALLLGERAAIAGVSRRGPISPGGSCKLVPASDGLLAVNLPRQSDLELVGAWLEVSTSGDPWAAVLEECSLRQAVELVERAQLVGLPVAVVPQPGDVVSDEQGHHRSVLCADRAPPKLCPEACLGPWRITGEQSRDRRRHAEGRAGGRSAETGADPGLVVDLSSMWAGPLCANLLGLAGFRVVKVESATRPDGARNGPAAFFDLLHGGHESVVIDFADRTALARLGSLLTAADVVIESSRPRALDQLGLGPSVTLARSPSTIWVSITGYGRSGPWQNRVAFGDDAAASAGMIASDVDGNPVFCGDALADPLAGLHAALAALAMHRGGHGGLVDVALRDVVASTLSGVPVRPDISPAARDTTGGWVIDTRPGPVAVREPTSRPVHPSACEAGADTARVLRDLSPA